MTKLTDLGDMTCFLQENSDLKQVPYSYTKQESSGEIDINLVPALASLTARATGTGRRSDGG